MNPASDSPETTHNERAHLSAVQRAFCDLYFRLRDDGLILEYSAPRESDLFVSPALFMFRRMQEVLPPDIAQRFEIAIAQLRGEQREVVFEYSLPFPQGKRTFQAHMLPLRDNPNSPLEIAVVVRDVSDWSQASQERDRLAAIIEATPDLVVMCDLEGKRHYFNPAARELLGFREDEDLSQIDLTTLHPPETVRLITEVAIPQAKAYGVWRGETVFIHRDGHEIPMSEIIVAHRDANGQVQWLSGVARDISAQKAAEAHLRHQAFHDALTGLPNRALFMDRLEHALARLHRREEQCGPAVLFLDLDRFKVVNDTLGHESGDLLLIEVARRLRECLRPEDTAARYGGDEFTILLEDIIEVEAAVVIAARIIESLGEAFDLRGQEVFITASIGVVLSCANTDTAESLLRDADVALYRAKNKGRAQYAVFEPQTKSEPGA